MSDDFNEMLRRSAADSKAASAERLLRERELQLGARRTRKILRLVILICGLGALVLILVAYRLESDLASGLACLLFLPIIVAGITLFFKGGLAPNRVRTRMTKREQDLLDN